MGQYWILRAKRVERKDSYTQRQSLLAGCSAGLKSPRGHGSHFALVHEGNEKGICAEREICVSLQKATLLTPALKWMAIVVKNRFVEQLFADLPPESVIVLDIAG
jgi:hypothetical protein